MAKMTQAAQAIHEMVLYFLARCTEQSTLLELRDMALAPDQWREAHALFSRIRDKTLRADKVSNTHLQHQYSFEELCAKTLYNMADHSAGFSSKYLPPFDEDLPFYVVPVASRFARYLGVPDADTLFADFVPVFQLVAE